MALPFSRVLSIFDRVCTVLPLKNIYVSFLFVDILIWKYIILIYSVLVRWYWGSGRHYSDVMISAISSQVVGVSIVCSTEGQAQIKENIKAPRQWLLWGKFTGYRWIPCTKRPVMRKMFPFDDVIMTSRFQWIDIDATTNFLQVSN